MSRRRATAQVPRHAGIVVDESRAGAGAVEAVAGELASERRGEGRRLVLCHGFTQNRRCWGPFADHLADGHELVLVDAPGHGESARDDADLWTAARLTGRAGGVGSYIGYSMGGRVALHLALAEPVLVERLVLIGATAGITDDAERAARRRADDALAERILERGLEAFLEDWLAGPLFAGLDESAGCTAQRRDNRAEGLAASLRRVGTGCQAPLWSRLGELDQPVLLIAGADDHKFRDLADRMAEAIGPNATVELVPGGHAVHLEAPEATASVVRHWLEH